MLLCLPVLDCVELLCTVHVMKRVSSFFKAFKSSKKEAQFLRNVLSNGSLQAAQKGKSLVLVK